jgi:hypothetical protein
MFENLSAVDWASFEHAYGPATDIPDLLWALASPETKIREEALRELNLNVIHQSTHWPGCVEVVPFLFELLENESVQDRGKIIEYLQYLAIGGVRPYMTSPPRKPDPTSLPQDDLNRQSYEAIRERLPQILPLLHHKYADIRAAMAFLLAWFPEIDPIDSLRTLLDDSEEQVAASAVLALAFRGQDDPRFLLFAHQDKRAIVRETSAIALGWLGRRDEVIEVIEATIRYSSNVEGFPWEEDLQVLAIPVVLPLGPETRIETIQAITGSFRDNHSADEYLGGLLLGWAFPGGDEQPERLVEDLSATQLDIAFKILAKSPGWPLMTSALQGTGLPRSPERLKIYLGDAPIDLLETRIRFEHELVWRWWPVWKCLLLGIRAVQNENQVERDAVAHQLGRELGPEKLAWLAVWGTVDVAYNWANITHKQALEMTTRALELSLGDNRLAPLARQYLDRSTYDQGVVACWQLQAFVQACVAGILAQQQNKTLDASHDPMLQLALRFAPARQPLNEVLVGLPKARMETLLLGALALPIAIPERMRVPLGVWYFLDLCPTNAVLEGACALLDCVPIYAVHEPSLVSLFANAETVFLESLVTGLRLLPRAMAYRALIHRRGGIMTDEEVRREIRQRFWEGVTLSSFTEDREGLNPCVLCGAIYLELGLGDLDLGARGAILAPNEKGTDGLRAYTELRGGFLDTTLVAKQGEIVPPDSAVLEAMNNVLESGTVGEHSEEERQCCEINALHLLAAQIRKRSLEERI